MRLLITLMALLSAVVFATPVASTVTCPLPDPAQCDSGDIPYSDWTTSGFTFTQGDKLFSDFSFIGGLPNNTTVRFQLVDVDGKDHHGVVFQGSFFNEFSIFYTILVTDPNMYISQVTADIQGIWGIGGDPTLVKTVSYFNDGTLLGGEITSKLNAPGAPLFTNATELQVIDHFIPNGGAANAIGNGFVQAIPEPGTLALIGAGLIGVAAIRRKTR